MATPRYRMNTPSINKRLRKIELKLRPPSEKGFTLEALCRSLWHSDKKNFLELVRQMGLSHFARQFELETAERAQRPLRVPR
jgi:hypothetical protein